MQEEKIKINKVIANACELDIEGDILDVIKHLQEIYEQNHKDYISIEIEKEYDADSSYYVVVGSRLETDSEYEIRKSNEKKAIESKEAKERAEYEKLKAKYA